MKDLPALLPERPDVVRKLRDAYRQLKGKGKFVVMVSPRLLLPEDLKKEVYLVDYDLPDEAEVRNAITILGKRYLGEGGLVARRRRPGRHGPPGADARRAGARLREGLRADARGSTRRPSTRSSPRRSRPRGRRGSSSTSRRASRSTTSAGSRTSRTGSGSGRHLFTREAVEAGLPVPKGLLMMGMSGCGKSLSVKAIPALWNLPALPPRHEPRLRDGEPRGGRFHRALKTVEGLSPAILWIDEIEMAITGGREAGGGDPSLGRIFSTFLTWMQEKEALVFVAATANRIHLLPAEFIRKGRFDQVFFVDLPNETERKAIFMVHLKKRNADLAKFDVVFLAKATKGFNGAEIEADRPGRRDRCLQREARPSRRTTSRGSSRTPSPSRGRWTSRSRPSRAGPTTGRSPRRARARRSRPVESVPAGVDRPPAGRGRGGRPASAGSERWPRTQA